MPLIRAVQLSNFPRSWISPLRLTVPSWIPPKLHEMFERFKAARGEYPHRDMGPTPDQLSA
eukprot:15441209-Alexandrium_andersonii.AAC.1